MGVGIGDVKPAILDHTEFKSFKETVDQLFATWRTSNAALLKGFTQDGHPKALGEKLSEDLLNAFMKAPLIDPYDIYQHFMDYWTETMQDDCYIISAEGWKAGNQIREILQLKNKDGKLISPEDYDYKKGKRRFKCNLIPANILIARYFVAEQDAIEAIQGELGEIEQEELEELRTEEGGEEGLLVEVIEGEGDKQKITAKAVKDRIKEIREDPEFADERKALEHYSAMLGKQADAKSRLKAAGEDLDAT